MLGKCWNSGESCGLSICASTSARGRVLQIAQQREQQAEQRQEVLALGHLVGDRLDDALDRVLDRRERVAHHEDAGGDAADDEKLEGLPQDEDVAAFGDEAADQRADAHHKTEDEVQAMRSRTESTGKPPSSPLRAKLA